MIKKRHQNILI